LLIHPDRAQAVAPRTGLRILLLALCVGAGLAVGLAGQQLSGSDAWFLAIPILVAAGWLAVADPVACEPPRSSRADDATRKP
jgi:hypothetical protein